MKFLFYLLHILSLGIFCNNTFCQIQNPDYGMIETYKNFPSKYVMPRNVEVWLPEHYSKDQKFSVLYMHDGQMLFDEKNTWNQQTWNVDSTSTMLMKEGLVRDFIIVAIWNAGSKRHAEYMPQKPYLNVSADQKNMFTRILKAAGKTEDDFIPYSDYYLKFIVSELKPFIDENYSVFTDKENTFIAGSSMGGLITMYAITQYPNVFGGAACLSTHWPVIYSGENNPMARIWVKYFKEFIPFLQKNKLYFDCGDKTLDALYPPFQKEVDEVLKSYPQEFYKSLFFEGEDHSEKAWGKRFSIPLRFLLGK
jgi:enterochelin esterase-like enzyme